MRNKRFLSKVLASAMSLFMIAGMCPANVFAADTDTEETAIVTETEDVQEADTEETETSVEEAPAEDSEVVSEEAEADTEEVTDDSEVTAVLETEESDETVTDGTTTDGTTTDESSTEEATTKELSSVSIGGVTYYYTDTADDAEDTIYNATVTSRGGTKVTPFTKSDLTFVKNTDYAYVVLDASTALSGTLYGYTAGTGTATTYKDVYSQIAADTEATIDTTSDAAYDAVSSATAYTSFHAKDISSVVTYGTDADGNKAITGLTLSKTAASVEADTYVAASILSAAGKDLTEEQNAALAVTLKQNPMAAPSETTVTPALKSASIATSKYGTDEFVIVPDDGVAGYTWSEYWDNMYAATISDGTTTAGAVHWIDMYGEKCTSGGHYNKVEIALNNGTSVGANAATVSRYAAFYDKNTGNLKAGTYTITLYSEGYEPLEAKVTVEAKALESVSVGGISYYYTDNYEAGAFYTATVAGRGGPTVYNFKSSDLTQIGETGCYYTLLPNTTGLSGTLYGYTGGTATNYKDIYKNISESIATDDAAYDAVSSATAYTSFHAKDISSVVSYGTDADGNKAITGLTLSKTATSVEADTYVAASILSAAGKDLTEEQSAALAVTLKQNPTEAPAETTVTPALSSASITTSNYGTNEFVIVPDDSVAGYKWNEYWDNMYAATISDGTTTVGAVHWIDMYGEKCTSGYHYNKVEIALNNGTSVGANAATVSRYAAFYNTDGTLKNGIYTITLYSDGYEPLTATVRYLPDQTVSVAKSEYSVVCGTASFNLDAKTDGDGALTYKSSDTNVASVDDKGNVTIKAAGTATITVNAAETSAYKAASATVTIQVAKANQTVSTSAASYAVTYGAKAFNLGAKSTGNGALTYKSSNVKVAAVDAKGNVTIKAPGTATITVSAAATANYNAASKTVTVTVKKASQAITGKNISKSYTYKNAKKKAQSFSIGAKAKTSVSYKVSAYGKNAKKYISVSKAGKVTVKKGAKKGTYTINVKVTGAANTYYNAATKTLKIVVKVK